MSYDVRELEAPSIDRTPPQDVAAEQSVLGAMLTSKDAIASVLEIVRGRDFYRPANELIFDAILDLYGKGEPADAITVAAELTKRGEIARCGGHVYIHDLLASVAIAANASYYAEIVKEKAVLRRLVEASIKIAQMGYQATGEVSQIVDQAQQIVYEVTDGKTSEDYRPLSELIEPTWNELEAISSRGGRLAGVPTGFAELDELTNGLHPGQMVIIAARPAIGKALALDTELPTPDGWVTMGEVGVGDLLIGADGKPTTVVAATEIMTGRPCYRVTFDDGSQIVADAQHQWRATDRAARRAAAGPRHARFGCSGRAGARHRSLVDVDRGLLTRAEGTGPAGNRPPPSLDAVRRQVGVEARALLPAAGAERSYRCGSPVHRAAVIGRRLGRAEPPLGLSARGEFRDTVTTEQLAESVRLTDGRFNWAVETAEPLDLPAGELPLHPYALGVWLGGSYSAAARFASADPQIGARLRGLGHLVEVHGSVRALLSSPGVLADRRIPVDYLRGSIEQRRELLRGLMDTGGTVSASGSAQLSCANQVLAEDAYELIVSLGYRCCADPAGGYGRTPESPAAYTLTFTADPDVFKLPRKHAAMNHRRGREPVGVRYVTNVERVASVPVRCVQVDNDDHMYLAGRSMIPTHNSTLALDFARSAAIKNHQTTAIFSLEMSANEIMMRLLSAEAGLLLHKMRNGKINDDDWERLAKTTGKLQSAPLFIDDSPNLTMMEIRAKARRLKQRHDLKLVVIDYMQLMTSGKKVENRQVEVSEFSRSIKLLAKELEIPVIAISQLNRGSEQRGDKKPMLSDLRESGSLEQDADMVILLHREEAYNKDERPGEADFIVAKHRNGETKTIVAAFQGHYSRFVDMQYA